ncbi:hypothetical protein [Clostridium tyrobutyricum]|uniref:hypothetical protein n=1 Tax=Clostridium tyrobutyricum TaxID=1519 RepID=UPI00241CFDA1|nr:hypothetical protein [Clostridium tyrobutyricum]
MEKILKIVGNLVACVYTIYMFFVLLILIFMPIMTISDDIKIIETGYTVTGEYISIIVIALISIYFSLRFRNLRKMYKVFPFLFESIKFLTITNFFIALGTEVLNWSHITLSKEKHIFGISVFIVCLILWRILISIYYSKNPLVDFMPKAEEKMQNYSEKI